MDSDRVGQLPMHVQQLGRHFRQVERSALTEQLNARRKNMVRDEIFGGFEVVFVTDDGAQKKILVAVRVVNAGKKQVEEVVVVQGGCPVVRLLATHVNGRQKVGLFVES